MTLYLTDNTAPEEIARARGERRGVRGQVLPGRRDHQFRFRRDRYRQMLCRVLEAMAAAGMPLLVHGEVTDAAVDVFDRESVFIERTLVPLVRRLPQLKVVMEHITTREAVQFVTAAAAERRGHDHRTSSAAQSQRAVPGRHPSASLLSAGA